MGEYTDGCEVADIRIRTVKRCCCCNRVTHCIDLVPADTRCITIVVEPVQEPRIIDGDLLRTRPNNNCAQYDQCH
jgi:hypothetical protein